MRNFKTMGLALVAIFAMSAMGAAAAQAEEPAGFGAGAGTVRVDVEADGDQTFAFPGIVVTCEALEGHAGYLTETHTLTDKAVIVQECDTVLLGFIHLATTVLPEEDCHFSFTAGTWTGEDSDGSVHICEVTINQYKDEAHEELYCQEHVLAQTIEGVTYTNKELNEVPAITGDVDVEVEATVTDLDNTGCNEEKEVEAAHEGDLWAKGTNGSKEQTELAVGALVETGSEEDPAALAAGEGAVQIDMEAEGVQVFGTPGKTVTCEALDGHASYEEETGELTSTDPGITECDTVILGFIHFDTTVFPDEGCHFAFTVGTWTSESEDGEGSVDVCELTINQYTDESHEELYCQQHWPAQTVEGVTYSNAERNGTPTVTVGVDTEEIETTVTDFHNTGCNSHETVLATYEGAFWAYGTDKSEEVTGTEVAPES